MALRGTRQMAEILGAGSSNETRVTRQSVAVLGTCAGAVRVCRQMIEVLVGEPEAQVFEESLTSTIALTQVAHVSLIQVTAGNAVSISSTATKQCVRSADAANTLELLDEADLWIEAFSILEITDGLSVLKVIQPIASSALASAHTLDYDIIFKRAATSPITITQEAIYHGPIAVSTATSLALTGVARKCETFLASASSALSATQTAVASGTIRVSASNALALTSLADRGVFNRTASSELILSQSASPDYYYTAVSTLELTSTAVQGQIFGNAVSVLSLQQTARSNPLTAGPGPEYDFLLPPTVINLQQTVTSSIHMLAAQSALAIADTLGVKRPWYKSAESKLQTIIQVFDPVTKTLVDTISGLQDSATCARLATIPLANQHYLQLEHSASVVRIKAGGLNASAESVLELDYDLFQNVTGIAVSHLMLAVQASADRCAPLTSLIDLTQAAGANIDRLREAASALLLTQGLAYSLANNPVFYNYSPFIGEGAPGAPDPPPATLAGPLPGVTVPFQLFYPAIGPTDSVTLRCPNLGNKDRLSFNRVLRETRGGTLICYADPIWPKIQTLVLSFSGLKAAEKDALLEFMEDHLGLEIGLLDWEHRYWKGVIVTPNDPAVQDDRDSFSVSFDFEGEMDPAWSP